MKKIRVLFYKTPKKLKLKYIFNYLINLRTWSKYSHVELWTQDFKDLPFIHGTCWTSTMRDKDSGTVKRDADSVLCHPENWDYKEITMFDRQYDSIMVYMEKEVLHNEGYSKWDILKFLSPWHIDDTSRNICSEFVNNALVAGRILYDSGIVSPGKVNSKLEDEHEEIEMESLV